MFVLIKYKDNAVKEVMPVVKKLIGGDRGVVNIILIISIIFMLMIFIVSSYLLLKKAKEDNEINDSVEELIEDVIVENILGLGIDIIASKTIKQ